MRVLVTGNNGYVGPMVERALLAAGHQVTGLDTDYFEPLYFFAHHAEKRQIVKDIREVAEADLEGQDAVIHLAALSNDPMGALDERLTRDINYGATCRLADACKRVGVGRFVYASSCSLYGIAEGQALTEEAPQNPQTAYARSKVDSEKYLNAIADERFSPTFLRFSTAFGVSPRLRVDLVLNNLVAWATTTGKVRIMSDGSPWRPLIHIEDMARAMLAAVEAPRETIHGQAFNVGRSANNYQVKAMADAVERIVPNCSIEYTYEHGSDSRTYNVSFDKIERLLPTFQPQWNLERGVQELYQAYTDHGLTPEDLQGQRYIRLRRLEALMANGNLDDQLQWKERPSA